MCGYCDLRGAISIKYTLDLGDIVKKLFKKFYILIMCQNDSPLNILGKIYLKIHY